MKGLADAQSLERWWKEHSELDRLVGALEETLLRGSITAASEALEELDGALEDHFDVEERVYFPLIEKLSAEHDGPLRQARLGHAKVREGVETIRELLGRGELAPARRALAATLDRFRVHEEEEGRLVADLERLAGVQASSSERGS